MLWNFIRDWFVRFVFGGYTSDGVSFVSARVGLLLESANSTTTGSTNGVYLPLSGVVNRNNVPLIGISIGDWLSTTATIITLCLLVAFLFLVVRWLFKLVSGLITLRG